VPVISLLQGDAVQIAHLKCIIPDLERPIFPAARALYPISIALQSDVEVVSSSSHQATDVCLRLAAGNYPVDVEIWNSFVYTMQSPLRLLRTTRWKSGFHFGISLISISNSYFETIDVELILDYRQVV
jgi:hypothetical protein